MVKRLSDWEKLYPSLTEISPQCCHVSIASHSSTHGNPAFRASEAAPCSSSSHRRRRTSLLFVPIVVDSYSFGRFGANGSREHTESTAERNRARLRLAFSPRKLQMGLLVVVWGCFIRRHLGSSPGCLRLRIASAMCSPGLRGTAWQEQHALHFYNASKGCNALLHQRPNPGGEEKGWVKPHKEDK